MKRKILEVLVCWLLIFGITGCGNKIDKSGNAFEEVTIGQSIKNDIVEITFDKNVVTKTATNSDTDVELEEIEDKLYFIILGSVTNHGTKGFNFKSGLTTKLIFDNKYEYDVNIEPSEISNIDPLESKNFIIYASVPINVIESCQNYSFKFGFNDDFSLTNLNASKNKYELSGSVEQYGSSANVTNFQTFSEFIKNVAEKSDLSATTSSSTNITYVSSSLRSQDLVVDDSSTYFDFKSNLRYIYYNQLNEISSESLLLDITTLDYDNNYDYYFADSLELISNEGLLKVSSSNLVKKFGNNKVSFELDFSKYDVSEIKRIVNGANFKIKIGVKMSNDRHKDLTFDIDNSHIEEINQLIEFNNKLQKEF